MARSHRFPFSVRVAITYAVAAALWIFFSDRLLSAFTTDPHLLAWLQTYKGWAFVAFTALLLYWLVRREEMEQASLAAKAQTAHARTEEIRQQLEDLIERVSDGFVALDNDWRYTYVNTRAGQLFGRKPEDLTGKNIWAEFPEGVGLPFYHAYYKAVAEQTPVELEEFYPHGNLWFENHIYPSKDGLSIFFHDITERKQTEERIQRQLAMLQALYAGAYKLSESMNYSGIAQSVTRVCVEALDVQLAWLGRAETDGSVSLLAQCPEESTYPRRISVRWDESPQGQGATGRAIRQGVPVFNTEISADTNFSPWRDLALKEGFHSSAAFPLISRGKAFGAVNLYSPVPGFFTPDRIALFQALTHQAAAALVNTALYDEIRAHATELEKRVAERTADLAATNQELEAFSYSVSHDLRAPLRAMQGFAQALEEDYGAKLSSTGREYVQRIVAAARRMDILIQDLLAYSRLSRADMPLKPVGLAAAVKEALAQLDGEIRQSGAQVAAAPSLPQVTGHLPTLTQVIANLVDNAIKFVPPGTTPSVKVWTEERGGRVRLWVEDNGIGISPEHQARIFRVFERLHGVETYPGTGIGLAIVHKGAERMGGEAGVESMLGKGSRFWVELDKSPRAVNP
ncbi:MAG: ATP-binding protein [Gammaproteobacteria bacterium]|nr:ATP-binding protein [Gammaproteobacteria bacterium]